MLTGLVAGAVLHVCRVTCTPPSADVACNAVRSLALPRAGARNHASLKRDASLLTPAIFHAIVLDVVDRSDGFALHSIADFHIYSRKSVRIATSTYLVPPPTTSIISYYALGPIVW